MYASSDHCHTNHRVQLKIQPITEIVISGNALNILLRNLMLLSALSNKLPTKKQKCEKLRS